MRTRALLWVGVVSAILLLVPAPRLGAHGPEIDLVVESVAPDPNEPLRIDYAVIVRYADGDPVEGARLELEATSGPDRLVTAPSRPTSPGVWVIEVLYPVEGTWDVTIAVEHPNATGTVRFAAVVPPGHQRPVVEVDTANPERVGADAAEGSPLLTSDGEGGFPTVTGIDGPFRVEALVREATQPLDVEYAVTSDRPVVLGATSDSGLSVGPVRFADPQGGVAVGAVTFPGSDRWTVTLEVGDEGTAVFIENLPWPHYTAEAGFPKVKVDVTEPDSVGELLELDRSLFALAEAEDPSATTTQAPPDETVVTRPESSTPSSAEPVTPPQVDLTVASPWRFILGQVGLRWLHLGSIGAWVGGLAGMALWPGKWSRGAGIAGAALTVLSGGLLALWGSPLQFPGMVQWEELGQRVGGDIYQIAFVAKMAAVGVAGAGTALTIRRRVGWWTAGLGFVLAVAAVTVMVQAHLFAHL